MLWCHLWIQTDHVELSEEMHTNLRIKPAELRHKHFALLNNSFLGLGNTETKQYIVYSLMVTLLNYDKMRFLRLGGVDCSVLFSSMTFGGLLATVL